MTDLATNLHGTWRLESWSLVYEDGRPPEFPLGEEATGYLIYTPDGHVSAALSRAGRVREAPGDAAAKARAYDDFFAYTGRLEVREGAVVHQIDIATNPALAGVNSLRLVQLDGDRLTLSGPDFSPGSPRSHRILWRRAR